MSEEQKEEVQQEQNVVNLGIFSVDVNTGKLSLELHDAVSKHEDLKKSLADAMIKIGKEMKNGKTKSN